MKRNLTNYTFDASAKTITLTDFTNINKSELFGITNATKGIVIYEIGNELKDLTIPVTIDLSHHQIHEGEMHQYTYPPTALSSGASIDFRIVVGILDPTNNKTPNFVLEVDATPVIGANLKLRQTGRYALITDFLPPDQYLSVIPSHMGIDSLTYPNSAYHATYEIYTTEYLEAASFPAGTYIVVGASMISVTTTSVASDCLKSTFFQNA